MVATYYRHGAGRSLAARDAERGGMIPLTRAIKEVAELAACPPVVARRVLRAIGAAEWHHVGKYASECDYYATTDTTGSRRRSAVEIAARVCTAPERARVLRARTREAWSLHAERRVAWELAEHYQLRYAPEPTVSVEIGLAARAVRLAEIEAELVYIAAQRMVQPDYGSRAAVKLMRERDGLAYGYADQALAIRYGLV